MLVFRKNINVNEFVSAIVCLYASTFRIHLVVRVELINKYNKIASISII